MNFLGVYQEAESNLEFEEWTKDGVIGAIRCLYDNWIYELCLKDMQTQGLNTLLNYPTNYKFDLIIFDMSTDSCLYSVSPHRPIWDTPGNWCCSISPPSSPVQHFRKQPPKSLRAILRD